MSKTFRYTKITGHYFCKYTDDWQEDGVEFEYEVYDNQLLPEIVELVFEDYFSNKPIYSNNNQIVTAIKESIKQMINDNDLVEPLADQYEEQLKIAFEDKALREYSNN